MSWQSVVEGSILAILLAVVVMSPVACTMHRHRVIAGLIEQGHDPLRVKCAIEGDRMDECMELARQPSVTRD